jgi:hypothetical protein
MTQSEFTTIKEYLSSEHFQFRPRMEKFMKTVVVEEKEKTYPKRTDPQRHAYFLWLEQIAEQCRNMGVTADMLFKHTMHISVTKDMLHHSIKALIKAKWNLDSTNDLRKTGHLDEIMDSVASWVGKENIEIPPFPSNETKAWEEMSGEKLGAHNNLQADNYPEYTGKPTI